MTKYNNLAASALAELLFSVRELFVVNKKFITYGYL